MSESNVPQSAEEISEEMPDEGMVRIVHPAEDDGNLVDIDIVPDNHKLSLLLGGTIGYLVSTVIVTAVWLVLAARLDNLDSRNVFGLVFVSFGAAGVVGAFAGCKMAARRSQRLRIHKSSDNRIVFIILITIVLVGSIVISLVINSLLTWVYPVPWNGPVHAPIWRGDW